MTEATPLGARKPTDLVSARVLLHHAAQLAAALGGSVLPPQPDDSHPNLGWDAEAGVLVGHPVGPGNGVRAGTALAPLELRLLDAEGRTLAETALAGRTREDALAWLAQEAAAAGVPVPDRGLAVPPYELPDHPVARGAAFEDENGAGRRELELWYALASTVLESLAHREPEASPVRCWPHHFDLATLIAVVRDDDGQATQTVGAGLSPGDETFAEPYFYVSPWPYPAPDALPRLSAGGHWHTQGFTAAVLSGSELLARSDDPHAGAAAFVDAAVAASREALTAAR
ncbi:MAG: hypothetical protein MJE66_17515 [Proteobacteria bacterium]|nr:hypothetical protein [Pseudomonadota bacterium]